MAKTILSQVTEKELRLLRLLRCHRPIVPSYRELLRMERDRLGLSLQNLSKRLGERGVVKSVSAIGKWENQLNDSPDLGIARIWGHCLGLNLSIFIYADDRALIGNSYYEKLRNLRIDKSIRVKDVSMIIGVHDQKISDWERGLGYPSESELKRWAKCLDVFAEVVLERLPN